MLVLNDDFDEGRIKEPNTVGRLAAAYNLPDYVQTKAPDDSVSSCSPRS